jgi:hypothetical protein
MGKQWSENNLEVKKVFTHLAFRGNKTRLPVDETQILFQNVGGKRIGKNSSSGPESA